MVSNALELIYYTFGKAIAFLLGCTFTSSDGTVSLLFIMFAVFLFGILFRFFLSVPRTYRGQRDRKHTSGGANNS